MLGDDRGGRGPDVPPAAVPARLVDFVRLAPAYVEVGERDIFWDESIGFARNLLRAGVSCELHVHPGGPHGYEWFDLTSSISERSLADRGRVLRAL